MQKNITYIEKLRDPRWQKKRLEILSRDNFSCRMCDCKEKTLHVHHCGYSCDYKNPWEYPGSYLLTLCEDCHDHETQFLKDSKNELLNFCSSYGYTTDDYDCLSDALFEAFFRGMKPSDIMTLILKKDREV